MDDVAGKHASGHQRDAPNIGHTPTSTPRSRTASHTCSLARGVRGSWPSHTTREAAQHTKLHLQQPKHSAFGTPRIPTWEARSNRQHYTTLDK